MARLSVARLSLFFFLAAFLLLLQAPKAEAQLGDAGEILRAGANDSNLLMENYLKPFGAGFGANLNTGWINTARPYRVFGFDLRADAALSFVPEADRFFSVGNLAFQELELMSGSSSVTPTVSGDDFSNARVGKSYTNNNTTEELFAFDMPQGTGYPYVPSPMAQLTLGIPMDSDISIRYSPTVEIPDVASFNLWGLGVKHGINQWLPGGEAFPVDLSAQFGYTKLSASASFDVQPDYDPAANDTEVPPGFEAGAARWDGQGIDLTASGYTANLLVGKTIPILSFYAGIGYQSSKVTIKTPGSYPITDVNRNADGSVNQNQPKTISEINSPINLELNGENSFHTMAGMRIRLAILTISGTYTLAKYPVANVGVGISIR
ncbi:MAG: DUF6588 family protein [Balneolaceae bacterium]